MKKRVSKLILFLLLSSLLGCSTLEFSRLVGVGTKPFHEKGKVYSVTFSKNYFVCYKETLEILKNLQANFYRGERRKNFIIAYGFNKVAAQCSESTEVAIFFIELGAFKTKVEVSSLNYYLSEFVSAELFRELNKKD